MVAHGKLGYTNRNKKKKATVRGEAKPPQMAEETERGGTKRKV